MIRGAKLRRIREWQSIKDPKLRIAVQLAFIRKLSVVVKITCKKRRARFDKQATPIRRVMWRFIFAVHERYIRDLGTFSELGLPLPRKTSYKDWNSKL